MKVSSTGKIGESEPNYRHYHQPAGFAPEIVTVPVRDHPPPVLIRESDVGAGF